MLIINEQQIQQLYNMADAIQNIGGILAAKTQGKIDNPHRTVLDFPERQASALYMPSADRTDEIAGVKVVTIFPQNPQLGKPTTQGMIMLADAVDGAHLALMGASYLTRLRTGALSAIATDRLSRRDSKILTVVGTGAMAFEQVLGVLAVRSIEKIILVNRTPQKAETFGKKLAAFGISVPFEVASDKAQAIRQAHIICCATRSDTPVFSGEDLQPGTHINGVGSYLPSMREVDEETVKRADKIVVDDLAGVRGEAGELIHCAQTGNWSFDDVHAELADLAAEKKSGRETPEEITFFKSVGAAYFDLAVAKGVYAKALEQKIGTELDM
ncbi:ornithine cyclodeaminase family protein [Planococcus koreensis]|uniref:ornithine cyclodeaminase family protein n=1 Tax=Planococcus koreensis TaxID=112331 RepID=UPI0039FC69C6